jgi:hypothetical protein
MVTGKYSGGKDYYRDVIFCPTCNAEQERLDKTRLANKDRLAIALGVAAIGFGTYFFLFVFRQ